MPRHVKNELYQVCKTVAAHHARRGGRATLTMRKSLLRGPYYPILAVLMLRTHTLCRPVNTFQ